MESSKKKEAIEAKDMAENMMKDNDFVQAQRFASKAQHLYSGLEDIAQMLAVCRVHCSSGILGTRNSGWYSILQLDHATANEASVKKQYKKLALVLHPDKNRFPGAEAAFKLVGEAQRVLSEQNNTVTTYFKSRAPTGTCKREPRPQKEEWKDYVQKKSEEYEKKQEWEDYVQRQSKGFETAKGVKRKVFCSSCPKCNTPYKNPKKFKTKADLCEKCWYYLDPNEIPTQRKRKLQKQQQMFWTKCPGCHTGYQCSIYFLDQPWYCSVCNKDFIAHNTPTKTWIHD